uniref:Uncharacterized protein n=1 Tax=viral metagenome TaxID=1070528 RepID=A0A6C0JE05_9ZZZZ
MDYDENLNRQDIILENQHNSNFDKNQDMISSIMKYSGILFIIFLIMGLFMNGVIIFLVYKLVYFGIKKNKK